MNELTQQGIAALKSGDRASARQFLTSAVKQDPNDALAWLWLTGALDTDDERLSCLRQVLRIDPGNQAAARGMAQILERRTRATAPQPAQPEPVHVPTAQPAEETKPHPAEPPPLRAETAPVPNSPQETSSQVESFSQVEDTPSPPEEEAAMTGVETGPTPQPVRRRVSHSVANTSERPIFHERPSLVPALLCFWLFLFGSLLVANLLNGAPEINLLVAAGLGLILEIVVIYTIIRNLGVRYELTSQQLTLRLNGKRARIPITEIYHAELFQSFWQRLIGIGNIDIDAAVNGQLAHIRIHNIPRARMRTEQILYLVRDNASS